MLQRVIYRWGRRTEGERDVNKQTYTVKDSEMCQGGKSWGLGQCLFFDKHLFTGSQFQVGSSYLHLFSSPRIIYWTTQIGLCMRRRVKIKGTGCAERQEDMSSWAGTSQGINSWIVQKPCSRKLPPASAQLLLPQVLQGAEAAEELWVQRKEVHTAAARLNFADPVLTSHSTANSKWLVWICLAFSKSGCSYLSDTLLSK